MRFWVQNIFGDAFLEFEAFGVVFMGFSTCFFTAFVVDSIVPGDLLCIGVRKNGGPMLTAVEASGAAIVYRVRCSEREGPA
jgi:hypothetical protein